MLSGYLQNYLGGGAPAISLRDVSLVWDEVCVAFAQVSHDGRVGLHPGVFARDSKDARDCIAKRQSLGCSVSLAIGGANASFDLNTTPKLGHFVDDIVELVDQYGFDAVDFDLEGRVVSSAESAGTFARAIEAVNRRANVRTTLTPEWPAVQGGWERSGGVWGSQLALIDRLRDVLSCVRVQYYNTPNMRNPYTKGRVLNGAADQMVFGTRMLADGFAFADPTRGWFRALEPQKIGVAIPMGAAAAALGVVDTLSVESAVSSVATLLGIDPQLVEVACWSINWDVFYGEEFSSHLAAKRHPPTKSS